MDFETYAKLIVGSVAECGYDRFMPSLCIPAVSIKLQVLENEPLPDGDKQIALDWASNFTEQGRVLYCAYRNGCRQVDVVEITGTNVTNKLTIDVRPPEDQ